MNTSRLMINDNFAAFGAGLYSLSSLTSASVATANDDIYLHGCFVIFSSPSFTYEAAAQSSLVSAMSFMSFVTQRNEHCHEFLCTRMQVYVKGYTDGHQSVLCGQNLMCEEYVQE